MISHQERSSINQQQLSQSTTFISSKSSLNPWLRDKS